MQEITSKSYLVSDKGGKLDFVASDGELLASVAIPAGRVPVSDYWNLVPLGASVEISKGLAVLNPRGGYGSTQSDELYVSGANPDYIATSASSHERKLRHMISDLQLQSDQIQRRQAALDAVERMPRAPRPVVDHSVTDSDDAKP